MKSESQVPTWSLITVTYNSSATLRNFWRGAIPPGVEWLVVDNNSTDGTPEVAASLGARVVKMGRNAGFSAANNVGLGKARGAYVGFVNPDVTVNYESLASLREAIDEYDAIVAPQLVNIDGSFQPNGRGYPILWEKIRHRLERRSRRSNPYLLLQSAAGVRPVCWLIGAVVLGSRSTFERIDGWDDHFFLYYEDKDLCLRGWLAGVPVLLDGSARWVHGWARETKSFRLKPWLRELSSMAKFYKRYPVFLLTARAARVRYPVLDAFVYGASSVAERSAR